MLIELDGNYIDPDTIDSIVKVKPKTNSIQEGGAFEFNDDTEVTLKNGTRFVIQKPPEKVIQELQEKYNDVKDLDTVSSMENVLSEILKELKSISEVSQFLIEVGRGLNCCIDPDNSFRIKNIQ